LFNLETDYLCILYQKYKQKHGVDFFEHNFQKIPVE